MLAISSSDLNGNKSQRHPGYYTLYAPGILQSNLPGTECPQTRSSTPDSNTWHCRYESDSGQHACGNTIIELWNWGLMKPGEAGHLAAHPSSLTGFVDEPMVILGTSDTIALWYLPGAITNDLQASLQTHMLATLDPFTTQFTGVPEFSPARHQQGHMVWLYYLRVSADLQMDAGREWSQRSYLPAAILSGLYEAGRQAMQSLDTWSSQHNQDMQDALQHWPSVFY
ncbi:hypothetical protein BKA82DRAFT_4021448 [Pisolithus tinctorius]|nr:hypothetical protein BKA82DRAFT_4021448 [Pisolithus tinctorius]